MPSMRTKQIKQETESSDSREEDKLTKFKQDNPMFESTMYAIKQTNNELCPTNLRLQPLLKQR